MARLVANGGKEELYFDSDVKLVVSLPNTSGPPDNKPVAGPLACEQKTH